MFLNIRLSSWCLHYFQIKCILLFISLGIIHVIGTEGNTDWCATMYSCGDKKNSMCLYNPEINKSNCIKMMEDFENRTEWRDFWLALHNTFRDQVAAGGVDPWPTAANMRQLTWDSTLEEQARIFNYQCFLNKPDDCNKNGEYRETQIGQIQVYVKHDDLQDQGGGNHDYFKEFLKDLFLEVVGQYRSVPGVPEMIKNGFTSNAYGLQYFFSALLYANSMVIGGSLIRSVWMRHPKRIVRANTFSAPWYKGLPVYSKGYPCSNCPAGWSCNKNSTYKYLCAKPGYPEDGEYVDGVPGPGGSPRALENILSLLTSLVVLESHL